MKIVKLICPHCGATLSVGDGIDSFYCQFCGGKILLTGQDKNTIDAKVKLKEFEHIERLKNSELEQERYKIATQTKQVKAVGKILLFVLLLPTVLLLCLLLVIGGLAKKESIEQKREIERLYALEECVGSAMEEKDYEKALFYANQLYCSDDLSSTDEATWTEKRERYISMIKDAKEKADKSEKVDVPSSQEDSLGDN